MPGELTAARTKADTKQASPQNAEGPGFRREEDGPRALTRMSVGYVNIVGPLRPRTLFKNGNDRHS